MKFQRMKSADDTARHFLALRDGDTFIDHGGKMIEKMGDFHVAIGVGYNHILPIAEYLSGIRERRIYGRYVLPEVA